MENSPLEIKRLQGCINNLISVLAFPALWSGREPSQIVRTLLDGLVGMMRLDFAYAQTSSFVVGSPIEMLRLAQRQTPMIQPQEIGHALNRWLADELLTSPLAVPNPLGEGEVTIAVSRLGLQTEMGVVVAASQRSDFPTKIEVLLMRVAANQAAIGLQEARLLGEQKRSAEELEQKVAERTKELSEAIEELGDQITRRERVEEALHETHAELAHATRLTTVGEMTASIAHEVNQPLAAIVTNGQACLRLLSGGMPDLEGAREAVESMVSDGMLASEVIKRIRKLLKKDALAKSRLDLNATIQDVLALAAAELAKNRVSLRTELESPLPPVLADRVQLQQVVLNLVLNGKESMSGADWRPRELLVSSQKSKPEQVLIAVRDSGTGLDPTQSDHIFDAFYTTKSGGMGLGLSISRTIIEEHGGRLWATRNEDQGTTFWFSLPTGV